MTARRVKCRLRRAAPRAFTLIEMLFVVVILAIMTGVIVASYAGREQRLSLQSSAKDLAEAMRYAAQECSVRGCPHRVVLDIDHKSFWVESRVADGGDPTSDQAINQAPTADGFVPVEGRAGQPRRWGDRVKLAYIESANGQQNLLPLTLDFTSRDDGFADTLVLTNEQGRICRIRAYAGTGQVVIGEIPEPDNDQQPAEATAQGS